MEEGRKTRILLADGHRLVRQGIRRIFEAVPDFEVVGEADNGEDAVKQVQRLKPDVVLIETRMGKVDSVEVTRRVKAHHREAIVIVLTAYDDEEYVTDMLRAGAGSCLLKSTDADELVKAIRLIRTGLFVSDLAVEQRILSHTSSFRRVTLSSAEYLTRREFDVLKLTRGGLTNQEIAAQLGVGPRTVKQHLANIYGKMHVSSRTEAVSKAIKHGWLTSESD